MDSEQTWSRRGSLIFILLVGSLSFSINYKYILEHFSNGSYLLDSGWFAYLFASGDWKLINPKSIGDLSYYNVHISSYLSALSWLFGVLRIDRFFAFALHQGVTFAILAMSLCGLTIPPPGQRLSLPLLIAAAIVAVMGGMTLQIASFPHFEQATLAFCCAGAFFMQRRRYGWAAAAYFIACMVREDGGLFVALFLIGGAVLRWDSGKIADLARSKELRLAIPPLLFAVGAFWLKASYFTAAPTFSANFSGGHWSHVSLNLVLNRVQSALQNSHILIVLAAVALLSFFSLRYLVFLVLISPLVAAHLLAVRDILGLFEIYYVIPWMVVCVGIFVLAGERLKSKRIRLLEIWVILAMAILGSSPVLAWRGKPNSLLVAWPLRPIVDLAALSVKIEDTLKSSPQPCASTGVVALAPDVLRSQRIVEPDSDLARCGVVFLYQGEVHFAELQRKVAAAGYVQSGVIGERTKIYRPSPR